MCEYLTLEPTNLSKGIYFKIYYKIKLILNWNYNLCAYVITYLSYFDLSCARYNIIGLITVLYKQ